MVLLDLDIYISEMMKLSKALKRLLADRRGIISEVPTPLCATWYRDPLSHPSISRMSERERADLPFDRGRLHRPSKDG